MADDQFHVKDTKLAEGGNEESQSVDLAATSGYLAHEKLIGTIISEKYKIEKVLGSGGLGVVYKGTHLLLNRPVAIKVLLPTRTLDDKALLRFQREAQAAIDLKHPNIASIQDFGLHEDLPFIVMEFVDGTPLGELLDELGALEPQRALRLLKQLCDGLGTAHKNHVIHRDIKPDNLMIRTLSDGEEELKIIDFGIAKVVQGDTAHNLTQTGEVFGTPSYMSPEQCLGRKTDLRSDVYAVGCVAFEMFTGRPPFLAETAMEVIMKHIQEDPPTLNSFKDACPGIQKVVARALTKNPNFRYGSAEEMAEDIELMLAGQKPKDRGIIIDRKLLTRAAIVGGTIILLGAGAAIYRLRPAPPKPKVGTEDYWSLQIKSDPKNAKAFNERGNLYLKQEEYTKALADFNSALALDPKGDEGYRASRFKSKTYFDEESYVNALNEANRAVKLKPDDHRAYLERAAAEIELQRYDAAIADCEKSLTLNPKNLHNNRYWAYFNQACVYNITGRFSEGKVAAEKAIALPKNEDYPQGYAARADSNIGLKNYKEALKDANAALELNASHVEARLNRAFALYYLGKLDEALADVKKVVERDRKSYKGYVLQGMIYGSKKQFEEAIQCFESALEIDQKGDFTLYFERAKAFLGAGQAQQAKDEIANALRIEPKNKEALDLQKKISSSTHK